MPGCSRIRNNAAKAVSASPNPYTANSATNATTIRLGTSNHGRFSLVLPQRRRLAGDRSATQADGLSPLPCGRHACSTWLSARLRRRLRPAKKPSGPGESSALTAAPARVADARLAFGSPTQSDASRRPPGCCGGSCNASLPTASPRPHALLAAGSVPEPGSDSGDDSSSAKATSAPLCWDAVVHRPSRPQPPVTLPWPRCWPIFRPPSPTPTRSPLFNTPCTVSSSDSTGVLPLISTPPKTPASIDDAMAIPCPADHILNAWLFDRQRQNHPKSPTTQAVVAGREHLCFNLCSAPPTRRFP